MCKKSFNYKKAAHELLKQWMIENNLTGKYDIHHRDDTEECRQFNSKNAYYNRWGFDLDGKFEYGKYVIFMSHSAHISYHRKGKQLSQEARNHLSNIQKGKRLSDEHKKHISENAIPPWKGKKLPEELKEKLSVAHKDVPLSNMHKQHIKEVMQRYSTAYQEYKSKGGDMTWQQFRHAMSVSTLKPSA